MPSGDSEVTFKVFSGSTADALKLPPNSVNAAKSNNIFVIFFIFTKKLFVKFYFTKIKTKFLPLKFFLIYREIFFNFART